MSNFVYLGSGSPKMINLDAVVFVQLVKSPPRPDQSIIYFNGYEKLILSSDESTEMWKHLQQDADISL